MWKLKGYTVDAFDQTQVVYNIWANTKNDLPSTMTDIGYGTALGFGSTAQTFDDSKEWRWNGTDWVEQTDGQQIEISADDIVYDNTSSGMTATNVQAAIDELKDTDDTQDGALAELYGDNANQQLEIDYAINTGAKNLFPNTAISQTIGGVTFTVNDDGTVTVNGTKTNNDWFILSENNSFDAGTYILSDGLPNDTTDCQLIISTARSMSAAIMATAVNSRPQTKTFTTAQTGLYYAIRIASGKTVNNLTFKPMIRRAEITDDTYVPYAPTNRELYETCETKVTMQQVYGDATSIPANSNLNNYITPGIYYALIANVPTITNTPYNATGLRLVVEKNTPSGAAVFQTIYPTSRSHLEFYRRVYEGGSWSSWYKFEGTQVATVQSVNSLSTLNLSRNDLTESLDTNFDLLDSIPEEEEGEEDV